MLQQPLSMSFDDENRDSARALLLALAGAANASETVDELTRACSGILDEILPSPFGFFLICASDPPRLVLTGTRGVPPEIAAALGALEMPPDFFAALDTGDGLAPLISCVRELLEGNQAAPIFISLRAANSNVGLLVLAEDWTVPAQSEGRVAYARQEFLDAVGAYIGTALKRITAQERLARDAAAMSDFLNHADNGYWEADPEGRITLVNEAALRTLKRTADEVVGKRIDELTDADPERLQELREILRREGKASDFILKVRASDGEIRTIRKTIRMTYDAAGKVRQVHGLFRDITEQLRTQAALEKSNHELKLLHELATRLNNTLDRQDALNAGLDLIIRLTGADAIGILLVYPEEGHYDLVAHRGVESVLVQTYTHRPLDLSIQRSGLNPEMSKSLIEYMMITQRTMRLEEIQAIPRFDIRPILATGYQSLLAFPITFDRRVYGIVVVGSKQPDRFDDHAVRLGDSISALLGLALHNQALVTDLQTQVRQMEAVSLTGHMIQYAPSAEEGLPGVVREIRQTLGATYVVLHLLRKDHFEIVTASDTRETGQTFPIAPYEKRLLESDALLVVNDIDRDEVDPGQYAILKGLNMRAAVGARLFAHSSPRGILFVNQDVPRRWTAGEKELIQKFVQQIAYALENKRLLDEIHQQIRELQSLARAGQLISTAQVPDDALHAIAEEIARVFPADYVSFHLRSGDFLELLAESEQTAAPRRLAIQPHQYQILDELDTTRVNDGRLDATHPRQSEWLARYDIVADLGVPLVAGQKALGILYVCHRRAHEWTDAEARLGQTFAQQIAGALANARLLRESQMQVQELGTLARSAHLIASSRSPETALPQAAHELRLVLRADYVGFHLIEGDHLRAVTEAHQRWANLRYPIEAYHRPIIDYFQKLLVNDRESDARDENHRATMERFGFAASVGVPLVSRSRTLGILFASQTKPRQWQASEVRLIETYAQQIAGVLDNVQILNQLQARVQGLAQLAQFNEIAATLPDEDSIVSLTLTAGKDLFNADLVGLVLLEGDHFLPARNSSGISFPIQPPPLDAWMKQIIAGKIPFVIDDDHPFELQDDYLMREAFFGIRAMLLVPLVTAHQNLGILGFSFKHGHIFTEDQVQLAQTAANQLAMALANARLLREQNTQIRNLTAHSDFSLWCGTIHDSEQLQRAAIERICKTLGTRAGSIRLVEGNFLTPGVSFGYQNPAAREHNIPLNTYLRQVLAHKNIYVLNDLQQAPEVAPHWLERQMQEGFHSLLMIPLSAEQRVMGILTLFHETPHGWSPTELQSAEALTNILALAVSNTLQMEKVAHQSDELQATLDSVFSGVFRTDREGVILSWSNKAEKITGMSAGEMLGKKWHSEGPRVGEARHSDMLVLEAIADNETRYSISKRIWIHPSERQISLREVATPLHDRAGNVRGAVVAFWDRSEEQKGERAKADFINEVAHELGNKLGVLMVAAQQILGGKLSEKRRGEYKQVFAELMGDLEGFHQRLITLQHEYIRQDLYEQEINLEAAVQHHVALLRGAKKGHRFKVSGDFDFVRADAQRLAVVLENLLGNAVKYAPPGSQISIRSKRPTPDTLVLSIHNRGEPIPEEFKPHLFEPWQRANSEKPGSGLGLWLVRTKLREMGGEIDFESSARGGTTFFITLKRAAHDLPETESNENSPDGIASARKEEL